MIYPLISVDLMEWVRRIVDWILLRPNAIDAWFLT